MGFSATSLGDTPWLRSGSGISCLVPSTSRFLAGIAFASSQNPGSMPWAPFAASVLGHPFIVGHPAMLWTRTSPAAHGCWPFYALEY